MKIIVPALAAVSLIALGSPALAHPEGHEMMRQQPKPIRVAAKEAVVKLVAQSKLDASWAKAEAVDADFVSRGDDKLWIVTFENPAAKAAERKLYVTMTVERDFVSASFKAA